jgi:hypothetical protein
VGYIDIPIETEPVDLADEAFSYVEAQVPGWLPSPGNLEAWVIEALSQIASELRELAGLVPDSIFQFFGESILGLPPYPAVAATGTTTWTAIDQAGYQVDAGTLVGITPPGSGNTYAFEVVAAFTIPAGTQSIAGQEVRALEAGADASGITGTVEMLDTLDFIQTVTLDAATTGGQDPEPIDAYLDRLSDLLTLMTPRPILPQDFAILVERTIPGIARATAIDLYNPGPPVDSNCPRCVSVVLVDANGQPVSASIKQQADDKLQAEREVNFLTFILDPSYSSIDVAVTFVVWPGYTTTEVAGRVVSALTSYLSPGQWGLPPYTDTSAVGWINQTTVRYLELTEQVNRVDGVQYVVSLAFGITGQAQGTVDVVLPGVAPLPQAGTITATGQTG